MRAEIKAYSLIALLLALIVASLTVVIVSQPAEAREIEPDWTWRVYPSDRTNTGAYIRMKMDAIEQRVAAIVAEYEAEQAAQQAWEEQQAAYYEPTYYAPTYSGVSGDPDGLNSFVGIIDGVNGTRETAYSSQVLYHYRTSEWTPDEYGFYRTDDGYYVVASSDYEQGTIIETSRGEAMVLDSGCYSGIVDFYCNW
jgi:hypothetical protein